jgi:hypothetical protein
MADSDYSTWHFTLDALPTVFSYDADRLGLHLIIGTWHASGTADWATVTVEWQSRRAATPWSKPAEVAATVISSDKFAGFDPTRNPAFGQRPERGSRVDRTYAATADTLRTQKYSGNVYREARVPGFQPGHEVKYFIHATTESGAQYDLGPYRVLLADPTFRSTDLCAGTYGNPDERAWLAYASHHDGVTDVRIDLDDISARAGDVRIRVAGTWYSLWPGSLPSPSPLPDGPQLPIVSWSTDRISITVPDPAGSPVLIDAFGVRQLAVPTPKPGQTRVLLSHFCIQAINDLLEAPFASTPATPGRSYDPPRTYMQVTMSDELALYSSRPDVPPGGTPDGYALGFDMHRRFDVPYDIAFNGGVLTLMAHDCRPAAGWPRDALADIRDDIAAGLLHPIWAGYGSYRMAYYEVDTNVKELQRCADLQRALLGSTSSVLYPDSRLYKKSKASLGMLQRAKVTALIVDGGTGFEWNRDSIEPYPSAKGLDLGSHLLWRDRDSGCYVLFIDDELKDQIVESGGWDYPKPAVRLRRRLIRYALDPRLRKNILVYGDDFEKACGNGWFEGSGTGPKFFAFLEWMSADRPWLRAVSATSLGRDDCAGTIDLSSAIDPQINPGWWGQQQGDTLPYDSWWRRWSQTHALWAGGTLGEATKGVEKALLAWPESYRRNELYETAWLAFLHSQHECAWNKQPEAATADAAGPVREPEDFALVEGLQVRNALVWLKASVWAYWAGHRPADPARTRVNEGDVHDLIRALDVGWTPASDADHWDNDPLPTCTLYNATTLVVLDHNGGCVTHAFVMRDGKPVTVSGTFKSYQYTSATGADCDGPMLQNTVWTPNHRYLASDVGLGPANRTVTWLDDRPGMTTHELLTADNFNTYEPQQLPDGVRFTYRNAAAPQGPWTQSDYTAWLRQDGGARRAHDARHELVWHDAPEFTKTITLVGTTLTIRYEGAPDGLAVDNELCVDLFEGALRGARLSRHPGQQDVLIRSDAGVQARVRAGTGCTIDPISMFGTVQEAGGRSSEFLQLHRVLTDTVRIQHTEPDFEFAIDLDA